MTTGAAYKASLPPGGKLTGAKPRDIAGHTWRCYSTGILQSEWRTDGDRWAVGALTSGETYWAKVNGKALTAPNGRARRFRTIEGAMRAAVQA